MLYKTSLVKMGRLYNMRTYGLEYFVSLFLQFVAYGALMSTTYAYMLVYNEKGPGNFAINDVRKKIGENFGKILGAFFLFLLLIVVFGVVIGFGVALITESAPVVGVLLILTLVVGVLILGPNFMWLVSGSFLVIVYKEEPGFWAFGKIRAMMKDSYWWTWLLVVCVTLMIFFIALMFALPAGILSLIKALKPSDPEEGSSYIFLGIFLVCSFFATIVYAIQYIFYGFHFFNLEEKKLGKGLMDRINEIGTAPKTDDEQQY
jgi:hypothetical protein